MPRDTGSNETFSLYDQVSGIVKEVFTSYGYAKEADYELTGLKETWFSHIVTIDMPDHIQESDQIMADIEKEIKAQNLDIKESLLIFLNRIDHSHCYINNPLFSVPNLWLLEVRRTLSKAAKPQLYTERVSLQ
ncbi:hypothetical protein [Sporosarcina sp. Te-1]|uniref:hypothetical protein n=1 Tax=Sporosarcina sp. Te-1 TaxID=2818390 RepID=UPI001A9E968E|nr:hypothetical protein [Sporosarcina sp. Te-1]QTD42110.1 hypothetical protein J3U78_04580 [Sporosarcina sp. Te-1]